MDDYERSQIAEAFKDSKFEKDTVIIKEGDEGKDLFFLVEGETYASKDIDGKATEVKQYKSGDYFGELALLRNEPRAASIIARTTVNTVSIDRHAFKRLLGPLDELLKRNIDLYT
jgi:cAMP-dependent protein kinase regulator